jgi:pimeloyl-ACP methyl ester carboxylesterase
MLVRTQFSTATLKCYRVDDAKSLLCFVHGLGGSNGPEYWGRLPEFLRHAGELRCCDIAFWQYPTHAGLSPRLLELRRRRRLPEVSAIADSFGTDLASITDGRPYTNLTLIGHSMGGLVLFEFLRRQIRTAQDIKISGIAVLGSPFRSSLIARLASFLQMKSNRQVSYLSRDKELLILMTEGLKRCRALGISIWYIASLEDEIVASDPLYGLFDRHEVVAGPHLWMPLVSTVYDSGYQALLRFLRSTGSCKA